MAHMTCSGLFKAATCPTWMSLWPLKLIRQKTHMTVGTGCKHMQDLSVAVDCTCAHFRQSGSKLSATLPWSLTCLHCIYHTAAAVHAGSSKELGAGVPGDSHNTAGMRSPLRQVAASPPYILLLKVAYAEGLVAATDGKLGAVRAPAHAQCCQADTHNHLHEVQAASAC